MSGNTRIAHVTALTTAIGNDGRGMELPVGGYEVVDIDGAAPGIAYIKGPRGGHLVCIDESDPNIKIATVCDAEAVTR